MKKNIYSDLSIKELEDLLISTLKTFDVPPQRTKDPYWLQRNIGFRNSDNTDFDKANNIIKSLIQKKDKL